MRDRPEFGVTSCVRSSSYDLCWLVEFGVFTSCQGKECCATL